MLNSQSIAFLKKSCLTKPECEGGKEGGGLHPIPKGNGILAKNVMAFMAWKLESTNEICEDINEPYSENTNTSRENQNDLWFNKSKG